MSKTLTEQYYDLELEEGFYYAKSEMGHVFILEINPCLTKMYYKCEILGKVPDYYQFTQLEKRVDLLQKQLKEAQNLIIYCSTGDHLGYEIRCENYRITHHLSKWGVK